MEFELNLDFLRRNGFNNDDCDVFTFLEELRQSGVTNMFGALPYLEREFSDMDRKRLKELLMFYFQHYKDIYIFEDRWSSFFCR